MFLKDVFVKETSDASLNVVVKANIAITKWGATLIIPEFGDNPK